MVNQNHSSTVNSKVFPYLYKETSNLFLHYLYISCKIFLTSIVDNVLLGLLDVLHFLLHLYQRHGKLLSFQGFQVCNRVRIPDVSLIFKNTIISIVFLFIFCVTHEYIKQYADVAEFMVLELQFKIRQTLIDLSIV